MAQIMIVEDSQGTNKAICEYMKSAGHTLIPAFDGAEALNIFRDRKIDLIVLDIMLPKISGLAVLHEIRKSSNIPVIMLATVYKGNIIKNLIMDCQSYTKYRPNETMGGIFVSWRRKEELPTGA